VGGGRLNDDDEVRDECSRYGSMCTIAVLLVLHLHLPLICTIECVKNHIFHLT